MYTFSSCKRLPDGSIILIVYSDKKYLKSEVEGVVRANVTIGSIILISLNGDPTKTEMTLI